MKPILLKPNTKELIWGTEQWGISGHPNGDNIVLNKEYKGITLSELWLTKKELFGNVDFPSFPLLTKIIVAEKDLSIQVHPNDDYAFKNENGALGKTECWYIMDAKQDASIIIGHNANSKQEMVSMISEKKWGAFIREIPVKKGDFFFIEPGTVHAIKAGTVILETQQASDITYRVYDYDRIQNGSLRPLHIEKSYDVIEAPFVEKKIPFNETKKIGEDVKQLVSCEKFTVWYGKFSYELFITQNLPFLLCSIIEGECELENYIFKKGDHFILPNGFGEARFVGNAEIIFSSI